MTPMIHLQGASILGGDNAILHGVSLDIEAGEFAYIVGKVGSGKTSIIRTLIAELRPAAGECSVCGYDVRTIGQSEIPALRRKTGVVFQDFQLLQDRSVRDNLEFVLRATGWTKSNLIEDRIDYVLKSVGMERKADRMPHQLSGGEQQRAAIARAILNDPEVILADEPTGNLDPETAEEIMNLLSRINKVRRTTVVMVTHNLPLIEKFPGRVFVCEGETCREMTMQQ